MTGLSFDYFSQIFLILFIAIVFGILASHFKQSLVMGYILAGVLLGPGALGWIKDAEQIKQIAEIGLVLLMFTIGLEFSLKQLQTMRKLILGAGSLQVLATVLVGMLISRAFGFSWAVSVFIGCVMSLSSTAILSKELSSHNEIDSPQGRISIGIAIFQDIAVIPMMIFLPVFHSAANQLLSEFGNALFKSLLFLGAALVVGRYVFPNLLRFAISRGGKELLILTTFMMVFGTATASQWFGLSIALGAFVAGVLLSETEFNYEIHHLVFPFREVFMSLFFVSIGLLLDIHFLWTHLIPVVLLAAAILAVNTAVCLVVVLVFRYPLRIALFSALILAGIGEFSFVLIQMGLAHGLIEPKVYQLLLSLTAVTLFVTPFLYKVASYLSRRLEAVKFLRGDEALSHPETKDRIARMKDHVIICGFGPVGQNLAYHLQKKKMPFVIVEMNVRTVKRFSRKYPIFFGDAASRHVLEKLGAERAHAIAVTMLDPDGLGSLITEAKRLNPRILIVTRARYVSEIGGLFAKGVSDVVSEELETSKVFAEKLVRS